jgi:hypothetical protein
MAYIGNQPSSGAFRKLDTLVFNGSTATFGLLAGGIAVSPGTATNLIISINGVVQEPVTSYDVSGSNITFSSAPGAGSTFFGVQLGSVGTVNIVTDGSVTTSKLSDGSVIAAKLSSTAIADKLGYIPQAPLVSGTNIKTVNGASILGSGNIALTLLLNVVYDNRASLRALSPVEGDAAVVKGLGLFIWVAGSTEPDDDESAFATASGVWLLEAVSWDVTAAWNSPDEQVQNDDDEDEPLRFASSFGARVLTGSATCAITSLASASSASFIGTVTGAAIGDRVIATPPDQLGSTTVNTGRLSYHAWVSAADTVTVMLTNASAAAATTNTAIRANWPVTVIKS